MAVIPVKPVEKIMCTKCNRLKKTTEFYTKKDGSKPELCKDCLTMFVDSYKEDTFVWILKDMDIPYVPTEWNDLREKVRLTDPNKVFGSTVLGKYLSKMRLSQYKGKGWSDSEELCQEIEGKVAENRERVELRQRQAKEQYEEGIITKDQYKTLVNLSSLEADVPENPYLGPNNTYQEKNFIDAATLPDPTEGLTQEDRIYLATKWGTSYSLAELLELERSYVQMKNSFDITDADTIMTLTLLCKTNLKMNQAIDNADIETIGKLSKVSEGFRKTAKFTAAQKKEEKADFVDSVGQIVTYCEKEGGKIPKYDLTYPKDIVDTVIKDLKDYNRSLIYEDHSLAKEIEDYLRKAEVLLRKDKNKTVTDTDILEYSEKRDAERAADLQQEHTTEESENELR